MNPYVDSVLTVVVLFLLGLISPGPNFLVVVQSTLRSGRLAGFLTGLGAATVTHCMPPAAYLAWRN